MNELMLSPRWTVSGKSSKLIFRSDVKEIKITKFSQAGFALKTIKSGPFCKNHLPDGFVQYLMSRGVFVSSEGYQKHPPKQDRQYEYLRALDINPVVAASKLDRSCVSIVGVGGIGSIVVEILSGCGVNEFILIDDDAVGESNFNRQFMFEDHDVGRPKVDVAKDWILSRHPEKNVTTWIGAYPDNELKDMIFEKSSFVVSSFDSPSIAAPIALLSDCWEVGLPSSFASTGITKCLISPVFMPGLSAISPSRMFKITDHMLQQSPVVASSGASNSYTAAFLAEQVALHISGAGNKVNYSKCMIIEKKDIDIKVSFHEEVVF